jgi:putative membrane protein
MHAFWWAFWFILIVTLFSTVTPIPKNQLKSGERAFDILRRRYAAGQVSTEEYERRKAVLERDDPEGMATVSSTRVHHH